MTWIVLALVVAALVLLVAVVFRSHRPARRVARAAQPLESIPASQASGPAATSARVDRDPPPVKPVTPKAAAPAVVPQLPLSLAIPDLSIADSDEPVTVVTQRFQPQALQSFIENLDEEASDGASLPFGFILVSAVGRTDVGRRRKHNEDSYLVLPEEHLFVVADGMGGHAAGEVASAMAVETLLDSFRDHTFSGTPVADRPRRADELVRSIEAANRTIFAQASSNDEQAGMGTTIVAARFAPTRQRVYIAHVGDSRCYRLRGGEFKMLTSDHTMSAWGVRGREGEKLTRAVGIAATVEVDVCEDAPIARDQYLLCSDGLTKMLDDETIGQVLGENAEPEESVRKLIELANERGGRDNVTAIVIQVHDTASL